MRHKCKSLWSTPTVGEVCPPRLPKPAKSLAGVPSLGARLVILPGVFPFRGQVEGFVRDTSPRRCWLFYKSFCSVSRTRIAVNIVEQPCVEALVTEHRLRNNIHMQSSASTNFSCVAFFCFYGNSSIFSTTCFISCFSQTVL